MGTANPIYLILINLFPGKNLVPIINFFWLSLFYHLLPHTIISYKSGFFTFFNPVKKIPKLTGIIFSIVWPIGATCDVAAVDGLGKALAEASVVVKVEVGEEIS